jgi:CheY-like chemotaxis protein
MTIIKRILLADDDLDDVNLFSEALTAVDPSIVCEFAEHGEDALNILTTPSNEKPDIIILDLNMPVLNGWQCLQILKKQEFLRDIPVLIYSTSSNHEDKEKAFALDAFCFITKPDRFKVLKSMLSILLTTPFDKWPSALKEFRNVTFNESSFHHNF